MRDILSNLIANVLVSAVFGLLTILLVWFFKWEISEPNWSLFRIVFAAVFLWNVGLDINTTLKARKTSDIAGSSGDAT